MTLHSDVPCWSVRVCQGGRGGLEFSRPREKPFLSLGQATISGFLNSTQGITHSSLLCMRGRWAERMPLNNFQREVFFPDTLHCRYA